MVKNVIKCVGIVLVRSDGSVLAQLRDHKPYIQNPNTWAVVSGGMKPKLDKDLVEVGMRELFEETGYTVKREDLCLLNRDSYTADTGAEIERTILWARYDGVQEIKTNEGQEIRFIIPEEFIELTFAEGHRSFLQKASEKAFYSGLERKS